MKIEKAISELKLLEHYVDCQPIEFNNEAGNAICEAIEALEEKWENEYRTQPENEPLSLEELRQMDNQPVWTNKRCGVVRAEPGITRRPGMPAIYFNYGWEWADDVLACGSVYAHKPEQEEK